MTQAGQTINFAPLPNVPLSAGSITVSATATSGQTVSFGSLTSGTCSVTGTTVTLSSGGRCTIQATENGNTYFMAATPVTRSFLVTTVPQLVVTHSLSRSADIISAMVTITNNGSADANNVEITVAKIGTTATPTALPQPTGSLTLPALGGSIQITQTFASTVGSSGAATTLTIDGTYTGGSFVSMSRITLP